MLDVFQDDRKHQLVKKSQIYPTNVLDLLFKSGILKAGVKQGLSKRICSIDSDCLTYVFQSQELNCESAIQGSLAKSHSYGPFIMLNLLNIFKLSERITTSAITK